MSVFIRKGQEFYSFRFQLHGERHERVLHGITERRAAEAEERRWMRFYDELDAARTMRELVEMKEKWLLEDGVRIGDAFGIACSRPSSRAAGEERTARKRRQWGMFTEWMREHHPDRIFMKQVTQEIAEEFVSHIRSAGFAANTANGIQAVCSWVFRAAKCDDAFEGIAFMKHETQSHAAYTVEELGRIFGNMDEYLRPLFMVGLFSGLRLGDICTLEWRDVDFAEGVIARRQGKTGNMVRIPLAPPLESYLKGQRSSLLFADGHVFPHLAGQYAKNASTITNRMSRFLASLGMETKQDGSGARKVNAKGTHSLRHTFCVMAGMCGLPMPVVQSLMGHMTKGMTELYSRQVSDGDKRECMRIFGERVSMAM